MCSNSVLNGSAALFLFLLPLGRPTFRLASGVLDGCAGGVGCGFITCSMRSGQEWRACKLTNDKVKNATPGMGFPYRLEKKRSTPKVSRPAFVTTTSSPANTYLSV